MGNRILGWMGIALVLVVGFWLWGSGITKPSLETLAQCGLQSMRQYPDSAKAYAGNSETQAGSAYVMALKLCMEADGYRISVSRNSCDPVRPFETQTACYAPTSGARAKLYLIEIVWQNLFKRSE